MTSVLPAQRTQFSAAYGPWFPSGDSTAQVFSAGIHQPLGAFFGLGLGLVHVADERSSAQRTLTGGELTLRVGGQDRGLYGIAASGIGFRHHDGNPDAFWSVGAGFAFRLFSAVVLGVEGRYRVEDTGLGGFWRLDPSDRK
ncbi:MAG: hypothetical protein OEW06_06385, partial [Gemmatimonadota bacterium]|nr:hypothetical protein [Gemmatimonadota bacterium]